MCKPRRVSLSYAITAALLAALFFAAARSARAQGGIKLEAQAGLDGVCKPGAWTPVRVKAENNGADVEARLEVSYPNVYSGGRAVFAAERLSLPSASRKELFFYIPASSMKISVRLLEGETELAKKELRLSCGAENDLYIGVFSETPAAFDSLADLRVWDGGRARVARLTLADFPDQPQGLAALDALLISNADTGALSAEQKRALSLWVADGGILLATGGSVWQPTTAGLAELLPAQISSLSKTADFSALSEYLREDSAPEGETDLAGGKLSDGARLLVAQDGVPLLAEKRFGFGRVYYFAADPAAQPLSQWDGMKTFYENVFAFRVAQPAWADSEWNSYQTSEAIASIPELTLPNFLYICGWLAVYIVVIGPVNYLVLRRLKRMELAWVAIPVLAAVFSCAAYFVGAFYRGSEPLLHRLALAQGWDGVPEAYSNDLIGLYSPRRDVYEIQAREGFFFYLQENLNFDSQTNGDWIQAKNERGAALPEIRVDVGGMAVFGAEGYIPALAVRHDLTLTLTRSVPQLSGTITNASPYLLRDAVLMTPYDWKVLGDLAPNQPQKVSLPVYGLTDKLNDVRLLRDLHLPYYSSDAEDMDKKRRAAFLQAGLSNGGEAIFPGGFYLLAWVDDLPAPIELTDRNSKNSDGMAYLLKIEPKVAAGPQSFTLNAGMYEWASSARSLAAQIPSGGGYEVRLRPAIPVAFRVVNSLDVSVVSHGGAAVITGSLWNFESRTWDEIPNLSQSRIFNPARYVGADGELRFRFDVSPNDFGQIDSVNFELRVSP